jgi:hypothetical protein
MRLMLSVGCGMAAGVAGLAFYAAGEDDYYGDGTTRWEHATRDGGTGFVIALFVVQALIACALIVLGLVRKRTSDFLLLPGLLVYFIALVYAWAVLSVGH